MSSINPYNIDGTFPVANQDNPSQGFRDNFTNIKNNFIYAKSELADLQAKAVVTSALTGQSVNNNMNGTKLTGPQLNAWTQSVTDQGVQTIGSTVNLDFNVGNFQKITTGGVAGASGTITINFVNWPTVTSGGGGYAAMRVWFVVVDPNHSITLPSSVDIGAGSLTSYSNNVLSFDVPGNYIFEFSSIDGGQNYLVQDLVRNRAWFTDPNFYYNPTVTPALLVGYGDFLPLAIAVEQEAQDTISAKGTISSYNSVQNYNSPGFGSGDGANPYTHSNVFVPGFGVISSRSFVDPVQGVQIKAVEVDDPLGNFTIQLTAGSPSELGNITFNEAFSIRSYASSKLPKAITSLPDGIGGLQYNYSPGGNVQFLTKQDYGILGSQTLGYAGWPRADSDHYSVGGTLGVAMSIENDQSVKTWGATARNYQFVNLTATSNVNVSPYISTVIMDSTGGGTIARANVFLAPNIALQDGQELNISSNCAITTLSIIPFSGNVNVPVTKLFSNAVCTDGANVTYYFDNSGGYFPLHGRFTASGYTTASYNTTNAYITASNSTSITANLVTATVGTDYTGSVVGNTNIPASSSVAQTYTSLTAGTSIKLMFVGGSSKWYRV